MAEQMTARERVLAALRGEKSDRIPLISPVSLANVECMKLSKAYFPYANLHPAKMAALAETSYTILKFDSVMPYFGITHEMAALGGDVSWGSSEHFSTLYGSILKNLSDFKMPQNYLDRKPIQTVIQAIALLKSKYEKQVAIIGKVLGPLSLLFYLYGIQNTLNSLILEPEAVTQLLSEIKNLCIEFALAQIEAGADIITLSEDAAGELISRECYCSLVMQAEREIFLALKDHALVVFHLSGNVMDRADLFRDTGFHALSFDSRNDLPRLKTVVGDMKLIGGVNNPVTMLNGKKEDIVREVFYALDNGVSLVAPECAIPLRVSNENLLAMRDAVLCYEKIRCRR